jgi:hypothetical protein
MVVVRLATRNNRQKISKTQHTGSLQKLIPNHVFISLLRAEKVLKWNPVILFETIFHGLPARNFISLEADLLIVEQLRKLGTTHTIVTRVYTQSIPMGRRF